MNSKLLQKAIDELKSDNPDLSYLRGMLETMMDMQETISVVSQWTPTQVVESKLNPTSMSAAQIAAQTAEAGFIKGTKPGVDIPVISSGN